MNTSVFSGFWALLRERLETMPRVAVGAVVATAAFTVVTPVLVRRFPRLWPVHSRNRRSLLTDLTYAMMSPVPEVFTRALTMDAIALCALLLGHGVGPELLHGFGPLTRQPHWLIVLEMLVLSDFIYYWMHRLAHRVPVLWKLHAIHHSTEHMNPAAALRIHPFEAWGIVVNSLPLFALGFPLNAMFALAPFSVLYAFLIHSNLRFAPRRVSYVVNSPAYHRWHHSRQFRGYGTNYAGYFPLMDRLFGTYHFPKEPPTELGIEDKTMPETYAGQLLHPLRRAHSQRGEAVLEGSEQAG